MRTGRKPYIVLLVLICLVLLVLEGCNQAVVNTSPELTSQATSFSKFITAGADDVDVSTASTYFSATPNRLYLSTGNSVGNGQNTGLRFQGINVPKNAVICSANIRFRAAQAGTGIGTAGFTVKGIAQDNAPAFTGNADYNGRSTTTQSTNFVPTAWALDQYYSVDVKTIVQALVNRSLWASGNAMAFKIASNGTNGDLKAYSFESTEANKVVAQINVTYENPGVACGGTGQTQTVNYTEDTTNISNPERGFQQVEVALPSVTSPVLNATDISDMNSKAQTVVHRIYNLKNYKGTATTYVPIAQSYLDAITAEMNWARTNGFKMDIRFAYNFNDADTNDAPLSTIKNHIDQLTPILQNNSDVIAFMSAGFVGQFGEWHDSTKAYKLIGVGVTGVGDCDQPTPVNCDPLALNSSGKQIIDKLLAITNFGRPIVLRYSRNKREYIYYTETNLPINDTNRLAARDAFDRALQASQAYGTNPRARLGHMNDCFTGSTLQGGVTYEDNGGTYFPSVAGSTALNTQKNYLNQENQFLPQVGEACGAGVSGFYTAQFSACTPARAELIRMRWSHLTEMPSTFATNWTSQGCLEEFKKRLGYRFVLTSATFPTTQSGVAGQTLSVSLNIRNDGFARPYNPRNLELVLRKQGATCGTTNNSTCVRFSANTTPPTSDVRLILPGPGTSNTNLQLSGAIPSGITLSAGTYDLFLNLPDPKSSLNTNAKYSIRLGNTNMWNSTTGYNKLGSLTIN